MQLPGRDRGAQLAREDLDALGRAGLDRRARRRGRLGGRERLDRRDGSGSGSGSGTTSATGSGSAIGGSGAGGSGAGGSSAAGGSGACVGMPPATAATARVA